MARRASFSFFYAAVLALVLIACSHSQALTLRDFVRDYVSASAGAVEGRRAEIRSREDAAAALPIADASLYPAEPEEEYAAPRLHGGYKATLTIDIVCKMPQFSMLCNLMGLRNAFGDVRQHIYLDFDEANREVYIKADGTKPLFRFDWCGPVSYDIDDEKLQSSGKGEIRLSKEEPKCMQKNLRSKLKNDRYYFNEQDKTIHVKAKIRPHDIVGWVDGALDFKSCSDPNCRADK